MLTGTFLKKIYTYKAKMMKYFCTYTNFLKVHSIKILHILIE